MKIARGSIEKPILTWILILVMFFGGIASFFSLGRLEDPAFTIKTAVVYSSYPGASADEVAVEVSEPLESAIQQIGEVDVITSINTPGVSLLEVELDPKTGGDQVPAVWTELRAKVGEAAKFLPQGVEYTVVNDDFGDVFGIYYSVTAEGYSDAEKHDLARFLRRELITVDGVANVAVAGLPEEAIYATPDMALMVNQGIPPGALSETIAAADNIVPAGSAAQTRFAVPEGSDTLEELSGLNVGLSGEIIRLSDTVTLSRERLSDPTLLVRHNGVEAFTLGIAGLDTENIVEVGKRVEAHLALIADQLPVGVELRPIYQQHLIVEAASNDFVVNLAMSVAIVLVVLALFMGVRAAVVVGATLLLTVLGTLVFMLPFGIEMERISLGALIIAMGMLVDNAIVVTEGMQTAMQRGMSSRDAADDAAQKTQIPLLGATVIGIVAFAPIGLSPDATGEFMFSLFAVITISLLLSWLLAITVTPLLGHYLFKTVEGGADEGYDGPVFRAYGTLLNWASKFRWWVAGGLMALTLLCYYGFGQIPQQFFPNSSTPMFYVHYWKEQGTPIQETSADMAQLEEWLDQQEEVEATTTFVGNGATRFMLNYSTQRDNSAYGHMLVRTETAEQIPVLRDAVQNFASENVPDGDLRTEAMVFGTGGGDPIQLRISGPDAAVLRQLAAEAEALMRQTADQLTGISIDWRQREIVLRPNYAEDRAQAIGVTRQDIADSLNFATDGVMSGVLRENERQIPIYVRGPQDGSMSLADTLVYSQPTQAFVPIEQVIDGFTPVPQDTLIFRRDRQPTITLAAGVSQGASVAEVQAQLVDAFGDMALPQGYTIEWGGEMEVSAEAQEGLIGQLPLAFLTMIGITILLFNALRQPLIIWLLVPMAVNGVTIGLLGTGLPFTFTALLGLLSLSGMLIKNGIVLVEEIDHKRRDVPNLRTAIKQASVSRMRPVILAAATTILGMIPLLSDPFYISMAVTIMSGLAFATVLTLVAVPVFYELFFARDAQMQPSGALDVTA
jgi:multidrug efflux pump subunit AcrB